ATGDPVLAGGRAVGRLGTVVDHVDLGAVALALLKRGIPADTALSTGGGGEVAAVIDAAAVTTVEGRGAGRGAGGGGEVAAMIDAASVPTVDGPGAGRVAVERLRGTARRQSRQGAGRNSTQPQGTANCRQDNKDKRSEPPTCWAARLLREGVS